MDRAEMMGRVRGRREPWDVVVIGGGATGVGVAVDAASRDYDVLLIEGHDFGKGTSSRSTKLAHGGVRYLARGDVALVREALRERGLLRRNAPHLVRDLPFVVPCYGRWDRPYYGLGLKVYDLLAGRTGFEGSRSLSRDETIARLPTIQPTGLRGGVLYHDGRFDDARLLINLVTTAAEQGATLLNYARVTALTREPGGRVHGVVAVDTETGEEFQAGARVVVNATGAFCDAVRAMADPGSARIIAPSRGAHLVLDRSFLPGDAAMMVPRTSDGRVMFAIPWHGRTLVGTTDVPVDSATIEPVASDAEVDFLLDTASAYLDRRPTRDDIRSIFAGIRPLVRARGAKNTAALSRDHTIEVDRSGLVTVAGGKWTTYRNMAEDAVDRAAIVAGLRSRPCVTPTLAIHGAIADADKFGDFAVYGSDARTIISLSESDPSLADRLDARLPMIGAEVVWAARHEMARTVEDVLSRRTRALVLDARAAIAMAPRVASLLAVELGRDDVWVVGQVEAFGDLAHDYLPYPGERGA